MSKYNIIINNSILFVFITALLAFGCNSLRPTTIPKEFCYIHEVLPNITLEMRYFGQNNFIGSPIDSYEANTAILSTRASKALRKVQKELNSGGFGLKIFDSYRPQSAVNHFIAWALVQDDTLMKQQYYPDVDKSNLFELGYIAERSGHSRGSTLDLTIINLNTSEEIDMGSPYDFFGSISHHDYQNITKDQIKNRLFLKSVMGKYGFSPYSEEWWHYTLVNEPYPNTYFDFPIK